MKHGNRFIDRTGQLFGRLTARRCTGKNRQGNMLWLCTCTCGGTATVASTHLFDGHTKSCGCLEEENRVVTGKANAIHGHARHDGLRSATYRSWEAMKRRTGNKDGDHPSYKYVRVCRHWLKFENFLADMGERPLGTTLSRLGDIGNYCKRNCRWHTQAEQRFEAKQKV